MQCVVRATGGGELGGEGSGLGGGRLVFRVGDAGSPVIAPSLAGWLLTGSAQNISIQSQSELDSEIPILRGIGNLHA